MVSSKLLDTAQKYSVRKTLEEAKHFFKYRDHSIEKSGILYFPGRILPTQEIRKSPTLCDFFFVVGSVTRVPRVVF